MGKTELLEDTVASELDELDIEEPDLDDFGDDEIDDDFEGLSSDVDMWGGDGDYDSYNADRSYLYGLLR